MSIEYVTSPLVWNPTAADGVSVTPSGSSTANSAWVQITASTSSALVLVGLATKFPGSGASIFEFDIGVGGAGSEVVVATVTGTFGVNNGETQMFMKLPIPVDNVGSSVRMAVRMRHTGTDTAAWLVSVAAYAKPVTGSIFTTAVCPATIPSPCGSVSPTAGGSAWTSGSYTQLIASSGAAALVLGVVRAFKNTLFEIDIATGGAGSEVVVTTLKMAQDVNGGPHDYQLYPLLDNIPASTRIAVRIRASSAGSSVNVAILVYAKPL